MSAWIILIPIAVLVYVILIWVAPLLASSPELQNIENIFLSDLLAACNPESLEQIRYLLAISVVPLVFFILFNFVRDHLEKTNYSSFFHNILLLKSVLIQIGLLGFVICMGVNAELGLSTYFSIYELKAAALIALFYLVTFFYWRKYILFHKSKTEIFAIVIGALYALIWLSTSVFNRENLGGANFTVASHLHHYTSEFIAVLVGKTPSVDYFPQYQSLISYLLLPYFSFFGFSIFTFTVGMSLLSFLSLMCVFYVLKMLTRSWWYSLFLFIPIVGISFYSTFENTPPAPLHPFNYYAMWPLRYFFPSLLMFILGICLRSWSLYRFYILFFISGFALFNNLDHGLPALVATLFSIQMITLVQMRNFLLSLRIIFTFLAGISTSALCLIAINLFRTGSVGSFFDFSFQKIFALYGFYMIPAPLYGIHWLLYLTFSASLISAVFLSLTSKKGLLSTQIKIVFLTFCGIFGPGAMMYYVGRSHALVLITIFPIWAITVAILTWICIEYISSLKNWRLLIPWTIPVIILIFIWSLFTTQIIKMPSPLTEVLRHQQTGNKEKIFESVEDIRKIVSPLVSKGDQVLFLFPYGDLVANELEVKNTFPYSLVYSVFLKKQVEYSLNVAVDSNVRKIFALFPKKSGDNLQPYREWREGFADRGYNRILQVEVDNQYFEVWQKEKSRI